MSQVNYLTQNTTIEFFQQSLLAWFDVHGRHDLPWQVTDNPYWVWVSEIMLQQTQVKTVLNYFPAFINRFPTVNDLAQATWEEVAPYWAGLGYYARARNLHKASKVVAEQGFFPKTVEEWQQLSGIGRSTAGALMSLGLRQYGVILDGNVKRVLARFFAIEDDLSKPLYEKALWQLAEQLCPSQRNADYTQAIMDLGATICTPKKALCSFCPLQERCSAYAQHLVDVLPFKKSKKAIPTKIANVIILQHQHQWLWQIRDEQGIWGGLWCLPILDTQEYEQWVEKYQHMLTVIPQSAQISHTFTHFTWQLNIKMFHMEHLTALSEFSPFQWFSLQDIQKKAIPTAMKKVISAIQST